MTATGDADDADAEAPSLRQRILDDPRLILDDQELMRAILRADRSASAGRNVVDLRGVLVDRLEDRLDRLEDTHREVLAAAYENVAGTNQVHRACLALLGPADLEGFLDVIARDVPAILGVELVRLALEGEPAIESELVAGLPDGGVTAYVTEGRGLGARPVTLRRVDGGAPEIYGRHAGRIRSEAILMLDLGEGAAPALLALGTSEATRFHPDQGTDLLTFLGGVVERTLRRWTA